VSSRLLQVVGRGRRAGLDGGRRALISISLWRLSSNLTSQLGVLSQNPKSFLRGTKSTLATLHTMAQIKQSCEECGRSFRAGGGNVRDGYQNTGRSDTWHLGPTSKRRTRHRRCSGCSSPQMDCVGYMERLSAVYASGQVELWSNFQWSDDQDKFDS